MHRQAVASRQRLQTRQQSGQDEPSPTVIFVCVHNAGRSRMAEAFFNDLARGQFRAISAGTRPADRPHPEVVAAMAEIGITIADRPGRILTPELAESADKLVSMGCNVAEACPALTIPMEDWALDDPKGKSPEEVAEIRDQVEMRVRNLLAQLTRDRSG